MRTLMLLTLGVLLTAADGARSQELDEGEAYPLPCSFLGDQDACVWTRAEYILWWIKDGPQQTPLVTNANLADAVPGGLGQPGTFVVLGGNNVEYGGHSGGRFSAGAWLDDARLWGVEGSYLFLIGRPINQAVGSNGQAGSQTLAVPFFDVLGVEASTPLALPGQFAGFATLSQSTQLQSAEINVIRQVAPNSSLRVELLTGFRYLYLREKLAFATSSPLLGTGTDLFTTRDEFTTCNNFYGCQIGGRSEYSSGPFFLNLAGKVAFGQVQQNVNVAGFLQTNDFNGGGTPQAFPGGYFALPSNIGVYKRYQFGVVPELNTNVGLQYRNFRLFVGYTLLCTNAVVRPGKQIDRTINPTQSVAHSFDPNTVLDGPLRPAFNFNETTFWAQGINFGLEFRF